MTIRVILGMSGAVAASLALAACDKPQPPPVIDNAEIGNVTEDANPAILPNSAESPDTTDAAPSEAAPKIGSGLPTAFLGRWGMTEADCDISRSDTKGLVTVSSGSLKFYESLGKLESIKAISPTEVKASFAFSGEGQSWAKEMTLKLDNGGTTLIRVETNPTATYRHEKCA